MSKRPNFLIFVPDQLRADAVGAFGNPHISTPNLDGLAAGGTRFTNAYVQHPVCSPSRASFLTGLYPHTTGHRTLTNLLKADEPNLLRILKDAGYHVTATGNRGDTFAPGVTELSLHEHGAIEQATGVAIGEPYANDVEARLYYRGRRSSSVVDRDEASIRTAEQWLQAPPREPWTLYVPLFAPHCPFEVEEPWFSMYERGRLPVPLPPREGREPGFMPALREKHGLDRVTPELWREVTATYYGMISRQDDQLGRLIRAMEESGAADDTVVIFFSDHGEYLGDYGLIEKWPSGMDECLTRDPLIISGPGVPAGQERDAMVELIDVLPTILELAGVPAPHRHFGRSLVALMADANVPHREHAFTEGGFLVSEEPLMETPQFPYDLKGGLQHERPELVGKAIAVRSREWTYVWRRYEPAELYDRVRDRNEQHNLAGDPAYDDVLRGLHAVMLDWLVDTADVIPTETDPRWPRVDLPLPGALGAPAAL